MYGDDLHHHEHTHDTAIKPGYEFVKGPGKIDDPVNPPPHPGNFNPAWRNNVDTSSPHVVTNNKYFLSALDDANISARHPYENWAPVADSLRFAFLNVYGPNGTKTPVNKMSECQAAFIAVAKSTVTTFLDLSGQHTREKREFYRNMIENLTWVRTGDLKPR